VCIIGGASKPHLFDGSFGIRPAVLGKVQMRKNVWAILLAVACLVSNTTGQSNQHGQSRWPSEPGAYLAASSSTIPAFPSQLDGFRSERGMDFWGKPFRVTGTVRIFEGNGWQGIPKFPSTMNGCSSGYFMIRWRTASRYTAVESSVRPSATVAGRPGAKTGAFGYMSGTNCEQPMFDFGNIRRADGATLVDVYYELKFWQAAP
jgi:hypothetical protein